MKTRVLVILWFLALSVPLIYMMGTHVPLNQSRSKNFLQNKSERIFVYHFLGADCGCSESVMKSFLSRGPQSTEKEKVFVLGNNPSWVKNLNAKGFEVETAAMEYYENKFEIKAVPQMVVVKNGKILYSGGYSSKRNPSSLEIEDQKILSALNRQQAIEEKPIFGCVMGQKNRNKIDPLKIKYVQ